MTARRRVVFWTIGGRGWATRVVNLEAVELGERVVCAWDR